MDKGYFVVATDSAVGKTFVAAGLAAALRARGIDVGVFKPVETCVGESPTDAQLLAWAAGLNAPDARSNPYRFTESVSPHVAARLAGISVDEARLIEACDALREEHEVLIVDGAGGLMVPLRDDYVVADLVHELGLPAILVADAGMGTLNHTLLSLRCCQDYRIEVVGIVLNIGAEARGDIAERTNAEEVAGISGIPVLGTLPPLEGLPSPRTPDSPAAMGRHLAAHIDIDRILAWEGLYP